MQTINITSHPQRDGSHGRATKINLTHEQIREANHRFQAIDLDGTETTIVISGRIGDSYTFLWPEQVAPKTRRCHFCGIPMTSHSCYECV